MTNAYLNLGSQEHIFIWEIFIVQVFPRKILSKFVCLDRNKVAVFFQDLSLFLIQLGVSIVMVVPKNCWFVREKPI